jgi:hypothetical protein
MLSRIAFIDTRGPATRGLSVGDMGVKGTAATTVTK